MVDDHEHCAEQLPDVIGTAARAVSRRVLALVGVYVANAVASMTEAVLVVGGLVRPPLLDTAMPIGGWGDATPEATDGKGRNALD